MIMKRLSYIFTTILAAVSLSSCFNEIEDVFPQSSTERLTQEEQECLDLLLSSEQGWLVQYYPSASRTYGGFAYAMKFGEDGNVTVAFEQASDPEVTVTSHYSINGSSSVTLTFDTYNDYIHALSDPDFYGGNTFEGDFEFAFIDGSSERIEFRGIKTGNRIVFIALDAETDIISAINNVLDMKNQYFMSYNLGGSIAMECDPQGYNNLYYTPDPQNPYAVQEVPFAYSVDGLTFYEPVPVGAGSVQDFAWNEEKECFVSKEDASVELVGERNPMFMDYEDYLGTYTLNYNRNASIEVTLTPAEYGSTYYMEGFFGYTPVVSWTPSGFLSLLCQYLGQDGSYYVWLCPWDGATGYYTWSTSVGFNLVNNGTDPDNLVLTFEDNGAWGSYQATSILIYAFSSQTASSSTGLGYLEQVPSPTTLVKNN